MIIFESTHISLGNQMTPTKIDGFLILYESPDKGRVTSHLIQLQKRETTNEAGEVEITYQRRGPMPTGTRQYSEDDFTGKILEKLHADYLTELQEANPNVGFMLTLLDA